MRKLSLLTLLAMLALTVVALPSAMAMSGDEPSSPAIDSTSSADDTVMENSVSEHEEGAAKTEHSEEEAGHGEVKPMNEFKLEPIGPKLHVGDIGGMPVNLGLNKAVIYLLLAGAICCGWALWMKNRLELRPNRKQTFTEGIYEFAHESIAKATLGPKVFSRYMPYVASLFMFLWVLNIISFIPLPINSETVEIGGIHVPALGLYAAASNINVTLALTLVTFIASHYEGLRINGPKKYFGSWAPHGQNPVLTGFIWVLHAMSEMLRLVSLSVRLFANMLAGHLLILMMLALILIIGSVNNNVTTLIIAFVGIALFLWSVRLSMKGKKGGALALQVICGLWLIVMIAGLLAGGIPTIAFGSPLIALFFFLFEFGLVASLQAFIFAMLSGLYIGFAAEPQH